MNIAATARQSAIEVVKSSLRQSKDGIVLSIVLHPSDVRNELLTDPIGQRYMMALVPLGDDGNPVGAENGKSRPDTSKTASNSAIPTAAPKQGLDPIKSERSRQAYASMSEGEKAVTRAAMLCGEPEFQKWIGATDDIEAAALLRQALDIESRREIGFEPAQSAFQVLETEYLIETGKMADPR